MFSLCINLISVNTYKNSVLLNVFGTILTLLFYSIFILFFMDRKILKPFKSRYLILIGGLSYEFYLIHEALGISLISTLKGKISGFWLPIVVMLLIFFLFFVSFKIKKVSNIIRRKLLNRRYLNQ